MIRRYRSWDGTVRAVAALSLASAIGCGSSNGATLSSPDGGRDSSDTDVVVSPQDAAVESSPPRDGSLDAPFFDAPVDAGGPSAVFATTAIVLPPGNCGGAAVTQTFSVQNTGNLPLTVQANATGNAFSVSPAMLTVAAGATGTLTLSASVPQAATAGAAIPSVLSLNTNDPAHATASINLSVVPTGATLAWASSSPAAAQFGVQPEGRAATPIALTLTNTGNASASVTFGAPAPLPDGAQFTMAPGPVTLAPNGGTALLSSGFTPSTTTPAAATSTFVVTGAVCGASASSLSFSGQGGTGNVTGWPTGAPAMTFQGSCGGAAPAPQTFTLTNSGPVDVQIVSATFSPGATGWSSTASGAMLSAMGTLVVSVSAPAVPFPATPGSILVPTLTLTTDVIGDPTHQINLEEDAEGAVLAFDTTGTPSFGTFGNEPVGQAVSQSFNVVNTGNQPSNVTLVPGPNPPFGVSTATFAVGGAPQADTATFAPLTFGGATGTLGISGTNLCQPPPAALNLSGTGQSGGIALSSQ